MPNPHKIVVATERIRAKIERLIPKITCERCSVLGSLFKTKPDTQNRSGDNQWESDVGGRDCGNPLSN